MLKIPSQRLAQQAYERILDLILSGEARPGDLLNERRLADMLEMSRTPIRDALLMLETEGLLVRQGRSGLQVKQTRVEDFMDALEIRLLLEPTMARKAAGNVAESRLAELETHLEAALADTDQRADEVDREQTRWIDDHLHGLISETCGNPQLSSIILTLRRRTQIFDLKSLPERFQDSCREHADILKALRAGDGDAAADAMTRHLTQIKASIIARLARI